MNFIIILVLLISQIPRNKYTGYISLIIAYYKTFHTPHDKSYFINNTRESTFSIIWLHREIFLFYLR